LFQLRRAGSHELPAHAGHFDPVPIEHALDCPAITRRCQPPRRVAAASNCPGKLPGPSACALGEFPPRLSARQIRHSPVAAPSARNSTPGPAGSAVRHSPIGTNGTSVKPSRLRCAVQLMQSHNSN
jgi:hypothetical protein